MSGRAEELERQAAELQRKAAFIRTSASHVEKGNDGELRLANRLDVLDGAGWRVLHDRRKSPRSPANLDCIVVGPPGVVVIDAKNWSGGLLRLDDRGMRLGRWRKDDALHAAKVDAELVQGVARRTLPTVYAGGVLAFVQDLGVAGPVRHRDVVVLQLEHLLPWLVNLPRLLSVAQVDELAAALDIALPPRHLQSMPRQRGPAAPAWAPAPAPAPPPPKRPSRASRSQRRTGAGVRGALLRFAVVAAVLLTLPTTLPVAQSRVLQPLVEAFIESAMPPVPAATPESVPGPP